MNDCPLFTEEDLRERTDTIGELDVDLESAGQDGFAIWEAVLPENGYTSRR